MATNDSAVAYLFLKVNMSVGYLLVQLPLSVFILHLGLEQWKSKRRDPAWSMTASDFFTCHLALMELVSSAGYATTAVFLCGGFGDVERAFMMGCFAWQGETAFPMFTCLEHYVAVVHPVAYVGLRKGRGLVVRNACAAVVWAVTIMIMTAVQIIGLYSVPFVIFEACQMTVYIVVIFYCNGAVLRVLVLPKPGGAVESKWKVDRSKRYALFVIGLFLLVLSVRFVWNTMFSVLWVFPTDFGLDREAGSLAMFWVSFVSSLTQPLLYLQRARKLRCCRRVTTKK